MNLKITVLLSAFETQRHVTKETKGVISEMAALNARAIQLQEAIVKVASSKSTATQTEAQLKPASTSAASKRSVPVKPPPKKLPASKDVTLQTPKVKEPVPPSFASVAKEGSKKAERTKVAPKRLRKKPEAIIICTRTCSVSSKQIRACQNLAAMSEKSGGLNKVSCCSKWRGKLLQACPNTEEQLKNPFGQWLRSARARREWR